VEANNGEKLVSYEGADLIRTAVDYKFILVLLFLKRLNDVWKSEKQQVKKRLLKESGLSEKEAEEEAEKEIFHTFDIPTQYLWDEITKDVRNLPEKLATGISEIAKLNKELQGVIDRTDFLEFARNQENRELLRQLVSLFNRYDLGNETVSPDMLGDAYEHILMRFAPQRAKEGEIYTPRSVIKLMVKILDPKEKYGKEETARLFLYGQERNPTIYAICQMNLILHDIKNANIVNGDTLDYPRFRQNGKLQKFDMVVANPPWNQDGYGEDRLKKADLSERFSFGYSPQNTADWAWIQHMLASTNGKVAIVIDNGCPEKLFYNTGAPGAIIIFNKNKPKQRKDKILFINASNEFIKHPSVRRLNTLSEENINKIVEAYKRFTEISGFSKIADITEVKDNDYNLNVSLYATPITETEDIKISKEFTELKELEKERDQVRKKLEHYIMQLNKLMED